MESIITLLEDLTTQDISEHLSIKLSNLAEDIKQGGMDINTISFSLGRILWEMEQGR